MWATNVVGTRRVIDAVSRTGVPGLIGASSVGARSPAPAGTIADESWPTDGIPDSTYSWQGALTQRVLDARHRTCPVVRCARA